MRAELSCRNWSLSESETRRDPFGRVRAFTARTRPARPQSPELRRTIPQPSPLRAFDVPEHHTLTIRPSLLLVGTTITHRRPTDMDHAGPFVQSDLGQTARWIATCEGAVRLRPSVPFAAPDFGPEAAFPPGSIRVRDSLEEPPSSTPHSEVLHGIGREVHECSWPNESERRGP